MNGRGAWYVVGQTVLMIPALLAPLFGARSASWPTGVAIVGGLLIVAGIGIAVAASLALGRRSLSPFPRPKTESSLVQHGVFAVVRHPICSGLTVFLLGWGLAWSRLVCVVGALVLLGFFDVKARREERWLEAKFTDYAGYKRRVRKLVPLIY